MFDYATYVPDCAGGADTGAWPLQKYDLENPSSAYIEVVHEQDFQFATITSATSVVNVLTLNCHLTDTDTHTFECSPYADSQGNSWTSSGVWLSDTALRGRFQYVGATDGEDAEPCNGYWLFSAYWDGPLP